MEMESNKKNKVSIQNKVSVQACATTAVNVSIYTSPQRLLKTFFSSVLWGMLKNHTSFYKADSVKKSTNLDNFDFDSFKISSTLVVFSSRLYLVSCGINH